MSQKTKRNYCPGCKKETIWDYYEARGGFKHWKCRDCGEKETFWIYQTYYTKNRHHKKNYYLIQPIN